MIIWRFEFGVVMFISACLLFHKFFKSLSILSTCHWALVEGSGAFSSFNHIKRKSKHCRAGESILHTQTNTTSIFEFSDSSEVTGRWGTEGLPADAMVIMKNGMRHSRAAFRKTNTQEKGPRLDNNKQEGTVKMRRESQTIFRFRQTSEQIEKGKRRREEQKISVTSVRIGCAYGSFWRKCERNGWCAQDRTRNSTWCGLG